MRITSTREKIVQAALKLFSRSSYSKVSMDDIAREAGVSKGAVFHYFKSKLDLAESALASFLEKLVAIPLRAILQSDASFEEKVGRVLSLALNVTLKSDVRALLFLTSVYEELRKRGRGGFVKRFYEEYVDMFAEFLRSNGVPHPEARARIFIAVLDGLALQCMIAPEVFRDEELVSELKRELARMLRCPS